jgi:translocation and assembly module TamA
MVSGGKDWGHRRRTPRAWLAAALALSLAAPARAWDSFAFSVPGADEDLADSLRAASALIELRRLEDDDNAQDVLAAARADYARILAALYARGHYSAVITIRLDGREAADIAPLDIPPTIRAVEVTVDPGPRFAFGRTAVAPLAPGTILPDGFRGGLPAESGTIRDAAQAVVDGWRARSYAKAAVTGQDIVADHDTAVLDVSLSVDPGPKLTFGRLRIEGAERMRERRIRKIAGLPEGAPFDPEVLARATERLRRTGVFASVSLREDERITPPDQIGITATVVEQKPRRYSFGGELSSLDGALVRATWLHRNLAGGGERLIVSGEVRQIGAQASGTDYVIGVSLERPATLRADTTGVLSLDLGHFEEEDYTADIFGFGLGFTNWVTENATWTVGIDYALSRVTDVRGTTTYRSLSLPLGLVFDDRDVKLDARRGRYLNLELRPFLGFGTTDSGVRSTADLRLYRSVGEGERVTFAGRLQIGAVAGADLLGTPRDYLFYSGGGGTVRGQPFQSLGLDVLRDGSQIGGSLFLGASVEVRARFGRSWGAAVFADYGRIALLDDPDIGDSHAGAGIGLRYDAGFAPIRLDVAAPVGGDTGEGVQVYVGIGQSF